MIDADKRQAVFLLHQEGMGRNQIARQLRISPNTVQAIIQQKGQMPVHTRQDKIQVDAVMVPEMEAFAKQYGFRFVCHEKNHPNRKAGEERSFWTVETNFLPG